MFRKIGILKKCSKTLKKYLKTSLRVFFKIFKDFVKLQAISF